MNSEWMDNGFTCSLHSSIVDLPDSVWDTHIAGNHPMRSSRFFHCLEKSFPDRRFSYFLIKKDTDLVGLGIITEEDLDTTLLMPSLMGKIFSPFRKVYSNFMKLKLAMVGTFESMSEHWWFNRDILSPSQFTNLLLTAVDEAFPSSTLLIIRDFEESENRYEAIKEQLCKKNFISVLNMPLATMKVENHSLDEYMATLKGKNRATIRKALRKADNKGIKTERVHEFKSIIDECYPLYLQVHDKAAEFKREPIPKIFFHHIADLLPDESSVLTIRNDQEELLAFMLTGTSSDVNNPFIIGINYAYSKEYPLYYLLLWSEIAYAIQSGCREVDMGITSYFVKQTMGATLNTMSMVARIQSSWLRPLLNPLLPLLLNEEQPEIRSQSSKSGVSNT